MADFANPAKKKEQKIVDLCAGNGAVGLFLTPKSSAQIYEVEIQPRLADMAKRSIDLNGLEERVTVINDDLNNVFDYLAKDSIDTVTCNPPYFEDQPDSKKNPNQYLALARHELAVTLEQTIEQASGLLKMNGRVSYVHRPERLIEMIELMKKHRLEPAFGLHHWRNCQRQLLLSRPPYCLSHHLRIRKVLAHRLMYWPLLTSYRQR